jgi:hypothetical protein
MVGRRGSSRTAIGLFAFTALALSGNLIAQPPGSTPPAPPTAPQVAPPGSPGDPVVSPPAPQTGSLPRPGGAGSPMPPDVTPGSQPGSPPQIGNPLTPPGFEPPAPGGPPSGFQQPASFPSPQRFRFKIDPKTPTKDLLPTPPKVKPVGGPLLSDDLAKVPEVEFQARPEKPAADPKRLESAAHQLAKINHLNAKKTDAFMAALLESRDDLAGLPFAMGDDCRTSGERAKQFTIAVNTVRQALGGNQSLRVQFDGPFPGGQPGGFPGTPNPGGMGGAPILGPGGPPPGVGGQSFWATYATLCAQEDSGRPKTDKDAAEHATVARVAALSQMLAPESAEMRAGLVKYLTGVPHVEATRALARLAIYSPEAEVRDLAITALKVRRDRDYTDVLVKGLRYPFPAVAKRAADAVARTGRTDLIPELVAVLDEADPRMPATREVGGKPVSVVRELVRVNHHRNCVMCHAPGNPETMSGNAITAEVAVPGQPMPSLFEGYSRPQSSPDLMVRIDVTYLRQDFSAMMPVEDAAPWPEMQRFDFLVRERKLTAEEATAYREKLTPKEAGVVTPYHRAALAALRDMTGKDAAPTAEAWRKLLDLPAKTTPAERPERVKAGG